MCTCVCANVCLSVCVCVMRLFLSLKCCGKTRRAIGTLGLTTIISEGSRTMHSHPRRRLPAERLPKLQGERREGGRGFNTDTSISLFHISISITPLKHTQHRPRGLCTRRMENKPEESGTEMQRKRDGGMEGWRGRGGGECVWDQKFQTLERALITWAFGGFPWEPETAGNSTCSRSSIPAGLRAPALEKSEAMTSRPR